MSSPPPPVPPDTSHRWWYLAFAGVLALGGLILFTGYLTYSPVNRPNFQRIRRGMSEQAVVDILGPPTRRQPVGTVNGRPTLTYIFWEGRDGAALVLFDQRGEVFMAHYGDRRAEKNPLKVVLRQFGVELPP